MDINKTTNKKHKTIFLKIFVLLVCLMFAYKIIMGESNIFTIIGSFLQTLKPIFFAMFIAYILYIPAKRIELFLEKSKSKIIKNRAKAISIAVVYIITLLLIVSLIVFGGRVLAKNFEELIKMIPNYVNDAMNFFKNLPSDNILTNLHLDVQLEKLKQMDMYKQILQQISVSDIIVQAKLALNFVNGIFDVFVMIIVSIYLLYSRKEIQGFFNKTITAFFNQDVSDIVSKYIEKTNYIFFRFVTTQILDGFIVAIIVSIALSIMRVKYAVALGFLIGISNLIPFFGAIIGVGVTGIVTLFTGRFSQALFSLVVITILQQLDANILNPILLGESLEVNKILIITSVIVGGAYFGPIGMFLAVPVVTIITVIINDILDEKLRNKKINKILSKRRKLKLLIIEQKDKKIIHK